MAKQAILLTDEIVPPPALIRAGLEAVPAIIRAQGERASRRFIEFFTATIRKRNTRMAHAPQYTRSLLGNAVRKPACALRWVLWDIALITLSTTPSSSFWTRLSIINRVREGLFT